MAIPLLDAILLAVLLKLLALRSKWVRLYRLKIPTRLHHLEKMNWGLTLIFTGWFRSLSFGLLVVLITQLMLTGVEFVYIQKGIQRSDKEFFSFFQILRGLSASGLSWPSSLAKVAREKNFSFHRDIQGVFRQFEMGQTFSEGIQGSIQHPTLAKYSSLLSTLHLAHERGYSLTSFFERISLWLAQEFSVRQKMRAIRNYGIVQWVMLWGLSLICLSVFSIFQSQIFSGFIRQPKFLAFLLLQLGIQILLGHAIFRISNIQAYPSIRNLQSWIFFSQHLELWVKAGFELRYAWQELRHKLNFSCDYVDFQNKNIRLNARVGLLWNTLRDLHLQGAALGPCLGAIVEGLILEEQAKLEEWGKTVPQIISALLMLVGLPLLMATVLGPMLQELLRN